MAGAKFKSREAAEAYLRRLAEPPTVLPAAKPKKATKAKTQRRPRAS